MDPVSITCAAGTATHGAYWVSTGLYNFIKASKVVDKTVNELQCEVVGLQGVLKSIGSCLQNSVAGRKGGGAAGEDEIWTSLDVAIKDAQRTIDALQNIVQDLNTTRSSGFFRRAAKQVKLNLDAGQIDDIKVRIHTHTTSLQLALQMTTMFAHTIPSILPCTDFVIG